MEEGFRKVRNSLSPYLFSLRLAAFCVSYLKSRGKLSQKYCAQQTSTARKYPSQLKDSALEEQCSCVNPAVGLCCATRGVPGTPTRTRAPRPRLLTRGCSAPPPPLPRSLPRCQPCLFPRKFFCTASGNFRQFSTYPELTLPARKSKCNQERKRVGKKVIGLYFSKIR